MENTCCQAAAYTSSRVHRKKWAYFKGTFPLFLVLSELHTEADVLLKPAPSVNGLKFHFHQLATWIIHHCCTQRADCVQTQMLDTSSHHLSSHFTLRTNSNGVSGDPVTPPSPLRAGPCPHQACTSANRDTHRYSQPVFSARSAYSGWPGWHCSAPIPPKPAPAAEQRGHTRGHAGTRGDTQENCWKGPDTITSPFRASPPCVWMTEPHLVASSANSAGYFRNWRPDDDTHSQQACGLLIDRIYHCCCLLWLLFGGSDWWRWRCWADVSILSNVTIRTEETQKMRDCCLKVQTRENILLSFM